MVNGSQEPEESSYDALAAQHVSVRRVLGLFKAYATRLILPLILIVASSALGIASPAA